jgi:hypothetical protein
MQQRFAKAIARTTLLFALSATIGLSVGAAVGNAQNAFTPYTLPQQLEQPISPINPGTQPGSTAAIGGSATGTNPITGLPCNGSGSVAVSGAGGLPGTATPPPGLSTETLDQIPVGTPPVNSIYGSQNNLGAC